MSGGSYDDVVDDEEDSVLCGTSASANISDYGSYENDSDDDNDFNYCGDSDNYDDETSSGGGEDMEEDNSDEPSNYLNWMLIVFFRLQHRFTISNIAQQYYASFQWF